MIVYGSPCEVKGEVQEGVVWLYCVCSCTLPARCTTVKQIGPECWTALLHVWVLLCGSSLGVHCGACVGSWQQMQVLALRDIIVVPCLRICEGLDCRVCGVGEAC